MDYETALATQMAIDHVQAKLNSRQRHKNHVRLIATFCCQRELCSASGVADHDADPLLLVFTLSFGRDRGLI
jgi:hypothetical protein